MTDDGLIVRPAAIVPRSRRCTIATIRAMLRYCLRRLFVREVAEDVVADVFLQIARYLPGFEGTTETDFRRWLFRIARNAVNAQVRQTRRRQELWEAAARNPGAGGRRTVTAPLPTFERLDWPVVYQAILELEPRDQTILTLRFFADLPHDEIAGVIGMRAARCGPP